MVAPSTSVPLLVPWKLKYIGRSAMIGTGVGLPGVATDCTIAEIATCGAVLEMPRSAFALTVPRALGGTRCWRVTAGRVRVEQRDVLVEAAAHAALREVPGGTGRRVTRAELGLGQRDEVVCQRKGVGAAQAGRHVVVCAGRVFVVAVPGQVIVAGSHIVKVAGIVR